MQSYIYPKNTTNKSNQALCVDERILGKIREDLRTP